jgi:N-carbamoylputrescine amidase
MAGGPVGGSLFWGSSFIAGPQGEYLARAPSDAPAVICARIDRAHNERVRRIWPFLRDRRIDAYEGLTRRVRD